MVKKHLKPTQANPDGGIIEKEALSTFPMLWHTMQKLRKQVVSVMKSRKIKKATKKKYASIKQAALL